MKSLEELKKSVLEDGIIDADEVNEIREVLFADGKIDKEEAEFLFELNDAVSGHNNHSSWKDLMVEAVSSFVLDDEESPNEIDDEEADWLIAKVQGDGQIDEIERAILDNIKKKAVKVSPKLHVLL